MEYRSKYEDYECLNITEEEKEALQLYISSRHIDINSILELDAKSIANLSGKGWHIDLSAENITKNIDNIAKIYSAMYKYSKANPSGRLDPVYRGTTVDEINVLQNKHVSNRFVSTSIDSDVAMRFTEYRNGALVKLYIADDVPYIPMKEFLGETQVSEDEVLISPFTEVARLDEHYSDIEGVRRFSTVFKKKEFTSLSDDDRKKAQDAIESFDVEQYIKDIANIRYKLDTLDRVSKSNLDSNERTDVNNEIEVNEKQYYELSKGFENIKKSIHGLIQDRLKQVELDIDKDIEKEEEKRIEAHRVSEIKRVEQAKIEIKRYIDETNSKIDSIAHGYFAKEEQQEMINFAEENGVKIPKEEKYSHEMEAKFETLKANLEGLKEKLNEIEVNENTTIEEIKEGKIDAAITTAYSVVEMVNETLPAMEESINRENEELTKAIKERLDAKLSQDIKSKMVATLQARKQEILSSKTSFLDKITGKAKLKEAELQNLDLRIQGASKVKIDTPDTKEKIEEYMFNVNGILEGKDVDTQDNSMLNSMKAIVSSNLPVVSNGRLSTKKKLKALQEYNQRLVEENQSAQPVNEGNIKLPPISNLSEILDKGIYWTSIEGEPQDKEIDPYKTL